MGSEGGSMVTKLKVVLFVIPLLAAGQLVLAADERQPQQPTKAQELTGLIGVKENTKGRLSVENQNLRFIHSHGTSDVTANSIQDVITGSDSQRVIRGTLGTLSRFGPYGSDRFLSLFRSKMDTLTIRYRDGDGGIHGVIFTTPVGQAEVIRDQLVGLGAHTGIQTEGTSSLNDSDPSVVKDPVLSAQNSRKTKIDASAITVMMIQSDEVKLPAEFQVALYENLIEQLQKKSGFRRVYREGDWNSADASDLVVLHSTVRGFKKGSEMERQVTTVAGATNITVHCEFTDRDGQILLARDINGKVRFFGGNLKVTYDFAKKAAKVTRENFSPGTGMLGK
jgi:hypothetical protein